MDKVILKISIVVCVLLMMSCKNEKASTSTTDTAQTSDNVQTTQVAKSSNPYVGIWAGPNGKPLVQITQPSKTEFLVKSCDGQAASKGVTYPGIFGRGAVYANVSHRDFHKHVRPNYALKEGPSLLYTDGYGEVTLTPSHLRLPNVPFEKPVNPDE